MGNAFFEEYRAFENELVERFNLHPFFVSFGSLPNEAVMAALLQLGFISLEFVRWYERAKLGMTSEEAKELIRCILRDEIPSRLPTHQDDRLADLLAMGAAKERVLNEPASERTVQTVRTLYELVRYPQESYDLRVLVYLRIFGEILVAETYGHVVRSMGERFGLQPECSRFYEPHYRHDDKDEGGHSVKFERELEKLITDEHMLALAKSASEAAFTDRYKFYDQFVE